MKFATSRLGRRTVLAGGAAALAVGVAPFNIGRAQANKLKVGVLLPRSGLQAQIGIDCQRAADLAPALLKSKGFGDMELVLGDTETNPQIARAQAEKLIDQGIHVLTGCFDSGQTLAAAQVCEQKGIPFVVNIAAVPSLTEQGFKTVFRNFPTGPMIATDAFLLQKEMFQATGKAPKTVVLMHANDTFGTSQADAATKLIDKFDMPYKFVERISYDPAARDLSAEVRKGKSTNAEAVWVISRLNDAILLTREMVKQRWEPMGIISSGPGWYEGQYMQALGKHSDDVVSLVPWYDPNKPMSKALVAAIEKAHPGLTVNTNHAHTFEAMLIIADAYKRAGSTDSAKLIEALEKTDLKDNVTVGPGVKFDEKHQNPKTRCSAVQNRGGRNLAIFPAEAAETKPVWPMTPWSKRT
jgi:branched-chain amino acid transport system substrate-binding protein